MTKPFYNGIPARMEKSHVFFLPDLVSKGIPMNSENQKSAELEAYKQYLIHDVWPNTRLAELSGKYQKCETFNETLKRMGKQLRQLREGKAP